MADPAKKQKTDEGGKKEELEQDAKRDSTPKIAQKPAFLTPDTTLNVLPSTQGNVLVALAEGGLSNLLAGARANVGVKSGRYMFEAKIVEKTGAKALARFGFSAAEGSLFLGEDDSSVCFDNEGFLVTGKKKTKCAQPFQSDVMVAVVLNLDASSPNANTISLFKNGVRVSEPQQLPDSLKGKALFPAVTFRNAKVHLNFAAPATALPFKCKPIEEASQKDATITKYEEPGDGKYTALFPVSLPDEGSFDWLDSFIEKNPNFTELSDRAFVDWAVKSGLQGGKKQSNDKPAEGFGHGLDKMDGLKKSLMEVAALQPRNFVVMEVKGNLVKDDRSKNLAKFKNSAFKTVAEVVVGDPSASFTRNVKAKILETKQAASDKEFAKKKSDEKRAWMVKKKAFEGEKQKKKAEKERQKRLAEAKKKAAEAMRKKAEEAPEPMKAKADEVAKKAEADAEQALAEADKPLEDEEFGEPEPAEEEPPRVTDLTAEEKAQKFFSHPIPDLTSYVMNTQFMNFSLPASDEGFDSVKYTWNKEREAAAYVAEWISAKKQTTRVENIIPGAEFKKKKASWESEIQKWKAKHNEYKNMISKKEAAKKAKIARKAAEEKKKQLEAEKKAKAAEEGKEEEKKEEKKEEPAPVEEEDDDEEEPMDVEDTEVFGVEDICDIGNKTPLFKEFQFEDWTMASLRFELSLLVQSFAKDCNDPDRTGIHLDHLSFYFQKYYGRNLSAQAFGVKTNEELAALIDDTVSVTEKSVIESLIPDDLETNVVFIKLAEDARRLRKLQIDMGVESAKLKLQQGGNNNSNNNQGQKRNWEQSQGGKNWGRW